MREDVAELSLDEATAAMARFIVVSTATISRLESLTEIPANPRQLRTAFVLCLVCGVDPSELGLAPKDLGRVGKALPAVVRDALAREYPLSTKWKKILPLERLKVAA